MVRRVKGVRLPPALRKQRFERSQRRGSKAGIHYFIELAHQARVTIHLRLTDKPDSAPLAALETLFTQRRREADAFYAALHPAGATAEEKLIQRQALTGRGG